MIEKKLQELERVFQLVEDDAREGRAEQAAGSVQRAKDTLDELVALAKLTKAQEELEKIKEDILDRERTITEDWRFRYSMGLIRQAEEIATKINEKREED